MRSGSFCILTNDSRSSRTLVVHHQTQVVLNVIRSVRTGVERLPHYLPVLTKFGEETACAVPSSYIESINFL